MENLDNIKNKQIQENLSKGDQITVQIKKVSEKGIELKYIKSLEKLQIKK